VNTIGFHNVQFACKFQLIVIDIQFSTSISVPASILSTHQLDKVKELVTT